MNNTPNNETYFAGSREVRLADVIEPADLLPGDVIQLSEPCTVVIVDAEPGDPCPCVIVRVGDPEDEGPLATVGRSDLIAFGVTTMRRTFHRVDAEQQQLPL